MFRSLFSGERRTLHRPGQRAVTSWSARRQRRSLNLCRLSGCSHGSARSLPSTWSPTCRRRRCLRLPRGFNRASLPVRMEFAGNTYTKRPSGHSRLGTVAFVKSAKTEVAVFLPRIPFSRTSGPPRTDYAARAVSVVWTARRAVGSIIPHTRSAVIRSCSRWRCASAAVSASPIELANESRD